MNYFYIASRNNRELLVSGVIYVGGFSNISLAFSRAEEEAQRKIVELFKDDESGGVPPFVITTFEKVD